MKKIIRLNETQLNKVVSNAVRKVIREGFQKATDASIMDRAEEMMSNGFEYGYFSHKDSWEQIANTQDMAETADALSREFNCNYQTAMKALKFAFNTVKTTKFDPEEEQYDHDADFQEAKQLLDGKTYAEIMQLVKNDSRFSFGASKGQDGLIDLNFNGVLVTVQIVGHVLDNYEKYDNGGQFVGTSR